MTRYEKYMEGLSLLRYAAEAIDQAHAPFRDIRIDSAIQTDRCRPRNLRDVNDDVQSLLKDAETGTCDDCGERIVEHSNGKCPWWAKEAS